MSKPKRKQSKSKKQTKLEKKTDEGELLSVIGGKMLLCDETGTKTDTKLFFTCKIKKPEGEVEESRDYNDLSRAYSNTNTVLINFFVDKERKKAILDQWKSDAEEEYNLQKGIAIKKEEEEAEKITSSQNATPSGSCIPPVDQAELPPISPPPLAEEKQVERPKRKVEDPPEDQSKKRKEVARKKELQHINQHPLVYSTPNIQCLICSIAQRNDAFASEQKQLTSILNKIESEGGDPTFFINKLGTEEKLIQPWVITLAHCVDNFDHKKPGWRSEGTVYFIVSKPLFPDNGAEKRFAFDALSLLLHRFCKHAFQQAISDEKVDTEWPRNRFAHNMKLVGNPNKTLHDFMEEETQNLPLKVYEPELLELSKTLIEGRDKAVAKFKKMAEYFSTVSPKLNEVDLDKLSLHEMGDVLKIITSETLDHEKQYREQLREQYEGEIKTLEQNHTEQNRLLREHITELDQKTTQLEFENNHLILELAQKQIHPQNFDTQDIQQFLQTAINSFDLVVEAFKEGVRAYIDQVETSAKNHKDQIGIIMADIKNLAQK